MTDNTRVLLKQAMNALLLPCDRWDAAIDAAIAKGGRRYSVNTVYGWHFLYEGHKLRDGTTAPKNGEWLKVKNPVICKRGLHGSLTPYDALQYAPGPILCLCEFSKPADQHDDKFVSSRRRIIARMDATEMLRYYARMQALSVIHCWDAPDVVLDYLMTGDKYIRSAAWSATRAAAMEEAWSAAWWATRAATESAAAWLAAWSATRMAAKSAAARQDFNTLVYECFDGPMQSVGMKGTP